MIHLQHIHATRSTGNSYAVDALLIITLHYVSYSVCLAIVFLCIPFPLKLKGLECWGRGRAGGERGGGGPSASHLLQLWRISGPCVLPIVNKRLAAVSGSSGDADDYACSPPAYSQTRPLQQCHKNKTEKRKGKKQTVSISQHPASRMSQPGRPAYKKKWEAKKEKRKKKGCILLMCLQKRPINNWPWNWRVLCWSPRNWRGTVPYRSGRGGPLNCRLPPPKVWAWWGEALLSGESVGRTVIVWVGGWRSRFLTSFPLLGPLGQAGKYWWCGV